MATIGTKDLGHYIILLYRGVATNQGFYKYIQLHGTKVSGHNRGVAIKRGSTVHNNDNYNIQIIA